MEYGIHPSSRFCSGADNQRKNVELHPFSSPGLQEMPIGFSMAGRFCHAAFYRLVALKLQVLASKLGTGSDKDVEHILWLLCNV